MRTSGGVTWLDVVAGSEPLVLLHGFTGSPASWDEVVRALPARRTAVAVALPGHDPAVPVRPGFAACVDEVARLVREAEADGERASPGHLVGYSLGARVALSLAARHPGLVRRLTLVGVHPGLASAAERAERAAADARLAALLRTDGVDAFLRVWEALPLFATQARAPAEALERQRRVRQGHDAEALAQSLEHMGLGAMPDHRDELARLGVPVTLVTGELDARFSAIADELAARITGVALATVRDCGHNPLVEQPAALAALLAAL